MQLVVNEKSIICGGISSSYTQKMFFIERFSLVSSWTFNWKKSFWILMSISISQGTTQVMFPNYSTFVYPGSRVFFFRITRVTRISTWWNIFFFKITFMLKKMFCFFITVYSIRNQYEIKNELDLLQQI